MRCLIRFAHVHETFRLPEVEALAVLQRIQLRVLHYDLNSPFCIVELDSEEAAVALVRRAILCHGIYELWGQGDSYEVLHNQVKQECAEKAACYHDASFRFNIDAFRGKRSMAKQRELINTFSYLDFVGPIVLQGADLQLSLFEEYDLLASEPKQLYLGRWLGGSGRDAVFKYDLKKRNYISRTSMDAELSLVTANITMAAPGKLIFDPFVGTGSFAVSSAHFGATALGADIDGRSIRGTQGKDLRSNFVQYGTASNLLDNFVCDLVHCPLRAGQWLDGIICDPPYGVREGPKTLGYREGRAAEIIMIDGVPAHLRAGFIAPKRPYGFDDMMHDVLDFAVTMLVDNGRISMWLPTANDDNVELAVPTHPGLELISVCTQQFNKWARRLLTYQRLPGQFKALQRSRAIGRNADDVNNFRKKYFEGFRSPEASPNPT